VNNVVYLNFDSEFRIALVPPVLKSPSCLTPKSCISSIGQFSTSSSLIKVVVATTMLKCAGNTPSSGQVPTEYKPDLLASCADQPAKPPWLNMEVVLI